MQGVPRPDRRLETSNLVADLLGQESRHHGAEQQDVEPEEADRHEASSRMHLDVGRYKTPTTVTVNALPEECLVHILAQLSARDLLNAERVCKSWQRVVNDDASWHQAFNNHFSAANAPGERLAEASWRAEYIFRTRLISTWRHSTAKPKVADAKVSHLTHVAALSNGDCLAASSWTGRAVSLNPQSSHINKRTTRMSAYPAVTTAFEGDEVMCACIDIEGVSVLWGMRSGFIRKSASRLPSSEVISLGQRLEAMPCVMTMVEGTDRDVLVASADGKLSLFSAMINALQWMLPSEHAMRNRNQLPSLTTSLTAQKRVYVAGTADGDIHICERHGPVRTVWCEGEEPQPVVFVSVVHGGILSLHANDAHVSWRPLDKLASLVTQFASTDPAIGSITAIQVRVPSLSEPSCSIAGDFGTKSFFVAGHASGAINVWFLDHPTPIRQLQRSGHHKVTSLHITPAFILAGSVDGSIKVFEPMQGIVLRVLNDRATPRHALRLMAIGQMDERRWQVSAISVDPSGTRVVAGFGERIFAWSSSIGSNADSHKKRKARPGLRISSRTERFLDDQDIQDEIVELRSEREEDFAARLEAPLQTVGNSDLLENLSPEEALQYARLLSIEDEEQRQRRIAEENAQIDTLLDEVSFEDDIYASLSIEDDDLRSPSPSPSLKPQDPPQLDDAEAWPIARSPHRDSSKPSSPSVRPILGSSWSDALKKASPNHLSAHQGLASSSRSTFEDDLDLAIQLSLADETNRPL